MARWPGFWRLAGAHWRTGWHELGGSLSVRTFMRRASRYVPEIGAADVVRGGAGVRAQAVDRDGSLVDDFRITGAAGVTCLRNAPSPAATSSLAIAEYVVASFLHFARGLHRAGDDRHHGRFRRFDYRPTLVAGQTACVIGVGGIGREVGRLCAGLGMEVVGTRRSPAETQPEGFAQVTGPDRLLELLARSRFVAVCCQWTPETTNLIGKEALAAMKPGAILVNVARGEIVDEEALINALDEEKLSGVALDVYTGEFEHEPDHRLWDHERVIITPHVSIISDQSRHRGMDVFIENLKAYMDGRPLTNVVDWERGY